MIRSVIIAAPICIVASLSAYGAENPEASYAAMAIELFQSLPKNATVAIQPLSEDETKIPASILRSIEVGLTSALQRGSDFEVKLIARDRLQTIWKEAREFSNKKFEDMVAEAGAEVLLIGEVRPNADGIEISYRAFRVKGSGTGNVIASSKPRVMAMDWKRELGVQPTQINDTMKEMAEAMKRLAASGGLVSEPKTPAEFYHNARILAQRGEVDLAMSAYERIFTPNFKFVDPLLDLLSLANRQYGADGTRIYVTKKLQPLLSEELALIARIVVDDRFDLEVFEKIRDTKDVFPPLLVEWTKRIQVFNEPNSVKRVYFAAVQELSKSYKSGELQKYYFDSMKGAVAGDAAVQAEKNYSDTQMKKQRDFPVQVYFRGKPKASPDYPNIGDRVDPRFPISVCTSENLRSNLSCIDVSAAMSIREQMAFPGRGGEPISGAVGHACVQYVEYTDTRGIRRKEVPLVKFEDRLEYRPSDPVLSDIVECAGDRLDQPKPIPTNEAMKAQNDEKERKVAEENAQLAEKAALERAKLAELRGQSTNEADFNEYLKLERKFKQFVGEDILLGNTMAKMSLSGTYGTLAKMHLEMRDGVETLTRSAFFDKFIAAKYFLKNKCNSIVDFSQTKRDSKDAEGFCQPSNSKAAPAALDGNAGATMGFERDFGGSIGSVDRTWYEPISKNEPKKVDTEGDTNSKMEAKDLEWSQKKGWRTYKSAFFNGCVTRSAYKDGTDVIFGYSPKLSGLFVSFLNSKWKRVNLDNSQEINFSLSNGDKFRGEFKIFNNDSGVVIQSSVNRNFIGVLAAARWFKMSAQGYELAALSLEGSRDAITAVEECQKDFDKNGLNYKASEVELTNAKGETCRMVAETKILPNRQKIVEEVEVCFNRK